MRVLSNYERPKNIFKTVTTIFKMLKNARYKQLVKVEIIFSSVSTVRFLNIQGVTGGTDNTSGGCSLGQTIPI
jgi:hypothetical protein